MKALFQILAVVAIAATACGCASPYFTNRGHDAADIFTATAGVGLGAQARVGPVHAGLGLFVDMVGFRGGAFQKNLDDGFGLDFDGAIFPAPSPCGKNPYFTSSAFNAEGIAKLRGKGLFAASAVPFVTTRLWPQPEEENDYEEHPLSRRNIHYFTQIDCYLALAGGIRLGFNPGELLDFILGWTTLDIFGDDVVFVPRKEESNKALQAIGAKARLQPER